jgi:hypothetical protein
MTHKPCQKEIEMKAIRSERKGVQVSKGRSREEEGG